MPDGTKSSLRRHGHDDNGHSMSARILIVEDEPDLVRALEYNLQQEGFHTHAALKGSTALELARKEPPPDLVILDLMLPDIPGTEVCRQLRAHEATRNVPVLMLTARGEEIDRVVGFEVGADDYVVKPYSMRELMLRVRAILRRREPAPASPSVTLVFGRLRIEPDAHVASVDGQPLELTALEFKLLRTLLERKGRVQTRQQLLDDVWGIQAHITTRTVDTHVKRLRHKLGPAAAYIETLRGVGYRFSAQPSGEGTS
jgi:two-component system phosphate regulon response regulator PhoB